MDSYRFVCNIVAYMAHRNFQLNCSASNTDVTRFSKAKKITSTQRLQGNEVDTRMFEASGFKFGGDSSSDSASIFHFKSPSGDTATVQKRCVLVRHSDKPPSPFVRPQVLKRWDFDHKLQLMSAAVST